MNYNDPNFNVIVSSPGRTGSVLISTIFFKVTGFAPIYRENDNNIKPMGPRECLHSHQPQDVKLMNEHTFFILSKRNLIDTTFSNEIGQRTNQWRYRKKDKVEIVPFTLSLQDFMHKYNQINQFYIDIKPILPKNAFVIDYDEFKNDDELLYDILKISRLHKRFFGSKDREYPTKTPGTHRDWIINYDELIEATKSLDPIPCIYSSGI